MLRTEGAAILFTIDYGVSKPSHFSFQSRLSVIVLPSIVLPLFDE